MRHFNQTYLNDIMKFVSKIIKTIVKAPTIIQDIRKCWCAPLNYATLFERVGKQRIA